MPKELTLVEQKGLQDTVLNYYADGYTIGEISRKVNLTWQNIAYYLRREEEGDTNEWRRALDNKSINVIREIKEISSRLKKMIGECELLKVEMQSPDDTLTNPAIIVAMNKEIREVLKIQLEHLKLYTDTVEKVISRQEAAQLRKAFLEVISEEDPKIAKKIIDKLHDYKEKRMLLQ